METFGTRNLHQKGNNMQFTITFLELFFWSIYLTLPILLFLSLIIVVLGQVVGYMEHWSKFDSLYWSLITATTVGYGDFRPIKKVSKLISTIIAIVGMILTGIIIAVALNSASFSLEKNIEPQMIEKIKERVSVD